MGQLKYNIRERLDKLNRKEHEHMMRELLQAINPASRSTFYRWINTRTEDHFQIPYTHQLRIAALFQCTVDELAAAQM